MNNNKIDFNKSNLRIAPIVPSPFALSPIDLLGPINVPTQKTKNKGNEINNNNNDSQDNNNQIDNNNNNNSYPSHHQQHSGFQPSSPLTQDSSFINHNFTHSQSSSSLDDPSHTISVTSLNVKGFASNTAKFDAIIDDIFSKELSIIALQETHINEQTANILFKNRCALSSNTFPYRAYWDFNPRDRYSGVGIIIKSFVSTYVQKITRH